GSETVGMSVTWATELTRIPPNEPGTPRKTATRPLRSPTYQELRRAKRPPSSPRTSTGTTMATPSSSLVRPGRPACSSGAPLGGPEGSPDGRLAAVDVGGPGWRTRCDVGVRAPAEAGRSAGTAPLP